MDNSLILIFQFVVFIFAVIIHEVSHGLMAYRLGDPTAKDAGRLTLNPVSHIDPFGSIILPLFLYLAQSPILFGWAKPVPFNPLYLKNPERDSSLIALAGPGSNLFLAVLFAVILKLFGLFIFPALAVFINIIILVNVVLGIFNLVPIPPLDGSKILFYFLPRGTERYKIIMEQYGFFILLLFIFFGWQLIAPIILTVYHWLGGVLI